MKKNITIIVTLAVIALSGLASLAIAGSGQRVGQYTNHRGGCMAAEDCRHGMAYNTARIDSFTPRDQALLYR